MKRKFRTLISCLLIASLCIGLLSATALAADPAGTEAPAAAETPAPSSGESTGTAEDVDGGKLLRAALRGDSERLRAQAHAERT